MFTGVRGDLLVPSFPIYRCYEGGRALVRR